MVSERSSVSEGTEYDAFEALCDAVIRDDSECELMFFWKSHIDAGKEGSLLVVAGYLSTRPKWKHFNRLWKPPLTRDGHTDIFHATDFEGGWNDFTEEKGWDADRRNLVRPQLVDAVITSQLDLGVISAVDISGYKTSMGGWRGELFGDAYEFTVRNCMSSIAYYLQREGITEPVAHILELGDEGQGALMASCQKAFAKDAAKRKFFRFGRLAFDTKQGAVGLQAADMLAYYWSCRKRGIPFPDPMNQLLQGRELQDNGEWRGTELIVGDFTQEEFERIQALEAEGVSVALPEGGEIRFKTPPSVNVNVSADFSKAESVLDELEALMETSPDLVYPLVQNPASVAKLFRFETENEVTAGTGNLRVSLKPNDLALDRIAAIRASDGQPDLGE